MYAALLYRVNDIFFYAYAPVSVPCGKIKLQLLRDAHVDVGLSLP